MRVSIITPTCDRPRGMELCERYMARQTRQPDEWIVADSGKVPAILTAGQVHLHQPMYPGARNLACNIMRALDRATGDIVIVVEDDDYYMPNHIAACVEGLQDRDAYGCPKLRYYNVQHRMWANMSNRGAALCQTAVTRKLVPALRAAAQLAHERNSFAIDGAFWESRQQLAQGSATVVGIKGLPGTAGLGIGHRPKSSLNRRWQRDPSLQKLREWIGADAEEYRCLAN